MKRAARWQRDLIEAALDQPFPTPELKESLNEALRFTHHKLLRADATPDRIRGILEGMPIAFSSGVPSA